MERGPAEEPPPPRPPEALRRQKRRELDARRSRCRIRIGGHLERWCRLKDQLGFALHSQLAQFLLDRFSSHGGGWSRGEPEPNLLPADALQRLVALSHGHGQECGFVPDVKPPAPGGASQLVWECVAGHSFSWGVTGDRTPPSGHHGGGEEEEDSGCKSPGVTGRRRSLRRARVATESRKGQAKVGEPNGDQGEELGAGGDNGHTAPQAPTQTGTTAEDPGRRHLPEGKTEEVAQPQEKEEEEEEEDEDLAEDDDLTYADDLRDENYHPSLESDSEPQRRQTQSKARKKPVKEEQPPKEPSPTGSSPVEEKTGRASWRRKGRPSDEEVAQIGPKRIRKAAKREILLCDFEGCGKIFSNRQYLNHHKKYQHVHQKTFTCSEPSCGKSFNFKKHLKEHEKLHSDKRDYICEFCARSFRTSSNLIIHRRIHTGEKPLQCEICGFTCRQKASLNWHMRKHDAASFYRFSCDLCGKRFEKKDNVTAHKSKSHPEAPPGTPQTEGGGPGPPSPPSGLRMEKQERPRTSVVEPSETAGLGDIVADGGHREKVPPGGCGGDVGRDPGAPPGREMDGVGS